MQGFRDFDSRDLLGFVGPASSAHRLLTDETAASSSPRIGSLKRPT